MDTNFNTKLIKIYTSHVENLFQDLTAVSTMKGKAYQCLLGQGTHVHLVIGWRDGISKVKNYKSNLKL